MHVWPGGRNRRQKGIDWQYTVDNPRTKLKLLYREVEP